MPLVSAALTLPQILAAALTNYGCPTGIVSDNGKIFTAQAYRALLEGLEIEPCSIDKGKPWQNLIEAQFKIQLRLSQAAFDRAETLEAIQAAHATFIEDVTTTEHVAHQDRPEDQRTPLAVLRWVRGRSIEPEDMHALQQQVQFERVVNQHGYISIQRYSIYAERGLARQRVSVWLYEGRLQIGYQRIMLARYRYTYNRKKKQLHHVDQPDLRKTTFADPQLVLWELHDEQWRKVIERIAHPRTQLSAKQIVVEQLSFQVGGLLPLVLTTSTIRMPDMLSLFCMVETGL